MRGKSSIFPITILVLVICGFAMAQSPVFVDQKFSGATDPLTYFYQDPAVSQDSFGWNDPTDNMWGQTRRGRAWTDNTKPGTAERAYVEFDATRLRRPGPVSRIY